MANHVESATSTEEAEMDEKEKFSDEPLLSFSDRLDIGYSLVHQRRNKAASSRSS